MHRTLVPPISVKLSTPHRKPVEPMLLQFLLVLPLLLWLMLLKQVKENKPVTGTGNRSYTDMESPRDKV